MLADLSSKQLLEVYSSLDLSLAQDRLLSITIDQLLKARNPSAFRLDERVAQLDEPFLISVYNSTAEIGVKSSKFAQNGQIWRVYIGLEDFVRVSRASNISVKDAIDLTIQAGDIQLGCLCPWWSMGGFAYIARQLGYDYTGLGDDRAPTRNNTGLHGSSCKHGIKALEWVQANTDILSDAFFKYNSVIKSSKKPIVVRPKKDTTEDATNEDAPEGDDQLDTEDQTSDLETVEISDDDSDSDTIEIECSRYFDDGGVSDFPSGDKEIPY
jgi:hypothetical protein